MFAGQSPCNWLAANIYLVFRYAQRHSVVTSWWKHCHHCRCCTNRRNTPTARLWMRHLDFTETPPQTLPAWVRLMITRDRHWSECQAAARTEGMLCRVRIRQMFYYGFIFTKLCLLHHKADGILQMDWGHMKPLRRDGVIRLYILLVVAQPRSRSS